MDDANRAGERIERFEAAALAAQQECSQTRVTPCMIDGTPHCPGRREQQQRRVYGN